MGPTLVDPSFTPPGGSEVPSQAHKGKKFMSPDFHQTKTKMLLMIISAKGLMGPTLSGPPETPWGHPGGGRTWWGPNSLSDGFSRNESRMASFYPKVPKT